MKFTLPGLPPSVNHSHFARGRRLKPEARQWIENAGLIMRGQMHGQPKVDRDGRFTLMVKLYGKWTTKAGTPRKVDLSNRIKILEDVVAKICCFDDSQVMRIVAEKVQEWHGERTEVAVLDMSSAFRMGDNVA